MDDEKTRDIATNVPRIIDNPLDQEYIELFMGKYRKKSE